MTPVITVKGGEVLQFWTRAHNSNDANHIPTGTSGNAQELGVYYSTSGASTNCGAVNADIAQGMAYSDAYLNSVLANRGDFTNQITRVNAYTTLNGTAGGGDMNIPNQHTFSATWTLYQYTFPAGTDFTGRIGFRYLCFDGGWNGMSSDQVGISDVTVGLAGDANQDGKVSFADYIALANNFGTSYQTVNGNIAGPSWLQGDFNGDGKVSFADYILLANNFGQSVPEPMTLSLLAIGGLALIRRNRK